MRKLSILSLVLWLLWCSTLAYAGPKEDYEEAYQLYIAAGASVAAYSGRIGELTSHYLEQDGWKINRYVQPQGHHGARFLIAQKNFDNNMPVYFLAIVGTETHADVTNDLKVDQVYFAGSNATEFTANANKKNVANTEPKVHKGFNRFLEAEPAATSQNSHQTAFSLPNVLLKNKNSKLYITGHSLGGAAATIAGARLISMGISPQQIKVITFGAPAAGNAAFAAEFEPVLPLTRVVISGDMVTGVLQTLVGNYRQFGREIKWDSAATVNNPHELTGYVDAAVKNYYDKRRQAVAAGVKIPKPSAVQRPRDPIYIAPLRNHLPDGLTKDFWYMNEALDDEYRQTLPNCIINTETFTGNYREQALRSGCRWIIIPEVSTVRLKQAKNAYYIALTQTVYDVATNTVVDIATFSTKTDNLTPLEAFIHDFKGISDHQNTWLAK